MFCNGPCVVGGMRSSSAQRGCVQLMSRDSVMDKMDEYKEQIADQYDLSSDEVDSMMAGAGGAAGGKPGAAEQASGFDPHAGGHNAADEL